MVHEFYASQIENGKNLVGYVASQEPIELFMQNEFNFLVIYETL